MDNLTLAQMHKRHIKGTPHKAVVVDRKLLLCMLTKAVAKVVDGTGSKMSPKIYINTRILKHLYDKKTAEEYECIIRYLTDIVRFPDQIYANKGAKRGTICFVKIMQNIEYFVSIEHRPEEDACYVVTCFRLRKRSYLDGYDLLWNWKGGTPSS